MRVPFALRRLTCGLLMLACLQVVVNATDSLLLAAEPASVAVRQQSPDVEAIIKELETKATLGQGTWLVRSGRQDAPSESFETAINNGRWLWRSLEKSPAKSAGYSLYCDGHDSYVLPDQAPRTEVQEGQFTDRGVRFQNDILHKGNFQDYRFSGYLIHLHLMPRQLLGSLGGLTVVGKETLDNIEYIHLKADPKDDTLTKTDPAVQIRRSAMPVFDFYYQPQQKLIKRMVVTTGGSGGIRQEFTVQSTETYGTTERWPAQATIKTVVGSSNQIHEIEKPYLLAVEKFTSGDATKALDSIAKQVAATPFFAPVIDGLRTPDFYRQSLQVQDNLSDRVPHTLQPSTTMALSYSMMLTFVALDLAAYLATTVVMPIRPAQLRSMAMVMAGSCRCCQLSRLRAEIRLGILEQP